ncbi:hypothetical protein BbiDN127_O0028 (plasmid) [Borreliella bissettiae DN127]|uniref:Mlp lipofamily protein n=1 Tax=Borrelia bissettiae (strain DSM 17990 / CIP 109136 / DN127) TaxID=521010 RepID=G0ANK0_BORBD|nr:hypothetical protein [Borreliella bissettiae]AEL19276.1 hypothetical protein BbiDN127_O0028 [Borreliella bissettiae DN127]
MKYLLFSLLIFTNINLFANFLNNLTKEEQSTLENIKRFFKEGKNLLKNPTNNNFDKILIGHYTKIEYNEEQINKLFIELGEQKTKIYLNTINKFMANPSKGKNIQDEKRYQTLQNILILAILSNIYKQLRPKTDEFFDNTLLLINISHEIIKNSNASIFDDIFYTMLLLHASF